MSEKRLDNIAFYSKGKVNQFYFFEKNLKRVQERLKIYGYEHFESLDNITGISNLGREEIWARNLPEAKMVENYLIMNP